MEPERFGRQKMPIITHVLLYLAYLTISLAVSLALKAVGGQDLGSSFLGVADAARCGGR